MIPIEEWLQKTTPEITIMQNLLSKPLSDSPQELVRQITIIEVWQSRALSLLADANSYLDLAEQRELQKPSPEEWKELDRKVNLRAMTVDERRYRDKLDGITQSIHGRIVLGQSIMKKQGQESQKFQ